MNEALIVSHELTPKTQNNAYTRHCGRCGERPSEKGAAPLPFVGKSTSELLAIPLHTQVE